jgi:hypothetical protein
MLSKIRRVSIARARLGLTLDTDAGDGHLALPVGDSYRIVQPPLAYSCAAAARSPPRGGGANAREW